MYRLLYLVGSLCALMVLGGLGVLSDNLKKPNENVSVDLIMLAVFSAGAFFSFRTAIRKGRSNRSMMESQAGAAQPLTLYSPPPNSPSTKHKSFFERMSRKLEQSRLEAETRRIDRERQKKALLEQQRNELTAVRSERLEPIYDCRSILQRGEEAYRTISASLLETKSVGYRGRSGGVSFRVAKGVTLRTGSYGGSVVKKTVVSASGDLTISNKRLLFAGDHKSRAIRLEKIVSVERFSDGLGIHEDNKTTIFQTAGGHELDVFEALVRRLASEI